MRRRTRILGLTALLALVGLATTACGSDDPTSGAPSVTQQPSTTDGTDGDGSTPATDGPATPDVTATVAVEVNAPIDLVVRPGHDDLWLAERAGKVRRMAVSEEGRKLTPVGEAVLDLTDQTTTQSERGLLGLAFSADGDVLYVSYTDLDGNTRLVSYAVDGDAVDLASRTVVLAVDQPFPNHNGGHVLLGPDGNLWFGLGDGGAADDPDNRAQDPDDLLGKMLRIDPAGGDPEIVMTGLRNPWRFSFDTDGSLWIADVGQNQWEEIDHLPADGIEGANMGWSALEGTHANPNVDPEGRRGTDPVPPVFEYSHEGGNCSITGGFVYRGEAMPDLVGSYLFADYCAGQVRAIRLADDGTLAREYDLDIDIPAPVSFAADADGEPYVLSAAGAVSRLVPA